MKRLFFVFTVCMAVFSISPMSHAETSGGLVIVGTGSGSSILRAIGEAFTNQNPGISITIPKSIGSGGGIKAVGNDEYILGRVARDIQDQEKKYGLRETPFAKMPIVFFVNNSVPIMDITPEQVCGIYDGTTREWEEIGRGKGKIRVIRREDGDSSLLVLLRAMPGFREITMTRRSKTTFSDPSTVAECARQKNAVAFGTWPNVKNETRVHALKLDGVHPSEHEYPYNGTLSLIYKEKNYNGNLRKFVEFITSTAAEKAIIDAGGLPAE